MKRKRIRINDISVSYIEKESKNAKVTVVFIHGFPFNKSMWEPQFTDVPYDINVIAYDVRGCGGSTSGHGLFNMEVFVDDLIDLVEKLNLTNVVLCGCSMGGYIALRAYQKHPDRFISLILSGTHSYADDNDKKLNRFATIQSVLTHGKRVFSVGFVKKIFSENTINNNSKAIELIKKAIRRNKERDICATLLALASRTDTTSSLKDIKVPVLVFRGEEDQLVSQNDISPLLQEILDVRFVEFPDCGHLPSLENPGRFNGEMKNFLISKVM